MTESPPRRPGRAIVPWVIGAAACVVALVAVGLDVVRLSPGGDDPRGDVSQAPSLIAVDSQPSDLVVAPEDTAIGLWFPASPNGFVTDNAQVLSPATARGIESQLKALRSQTSVEVAVVTLPSIGSRDVVEVARAIGNAWGVGAADATDGRLLEGGLVLLLIPRTENARGQIRIEVARGLQPILTDIQSEEVIDAMMRALRETDYGTAFEIAIGVITKIVTGSLRAGADIPPSRSDTIDPAGTDSRP